MEYAIWDIIDANFVVVEVLADLTGFFVNAPSFLDSVDLVGAGCALTLGVD